MLTLPADRAFCNPSHGPRVQVLGQGDPLLAEQHELLAVADLARGRHEQLLGRGDG